MVSTTEHRVRLARTSDAARLAAMSRDYVEQGLPWRWKSIRVAGMIKHPDAIVIVAGAVESISGFAILTISQYTAHLNLLAVKPAMRRKGIAQSLITWLVESCKVAGLGRINLEVRKQNAGAMTFYLDNEFEVSGIARGYYEGIDDAALMTRRLISQNDEMNRP